MLYRKARKGGANGRKENRHGQELQESMR